MRLYLLFAFVLSCCLLHLSAAGVSHGLGQALQGVGHHHNSTGSPPPRGAPPPPPPSTTAASG
ncbi:uncharacterized protein LOC111071639 [Drosophila obscura]|uniref:uncharacterized protein LOC111071639 n=1 Tax=Drosophila obscura TaxID=7282 RepID=UPI001BB1E342|nr:uncharacterized protein LOC111071639 [Drosophila obscura]